MITDVHVGAWTEDDLADLPENGQRYELLEGALVVNPLPTGLHQATRWRLARQLHDSCPPDLLVVEALGVRLPEGTVFVPDVLVAERDAVVGADGGILDCRTVHLVAEIVSPGSRTADRLTKPALYARAGIATFLRVEVQDGPSIIAFHLDRDAYVESGSAAPGDVVRLDEPFPVALLPTDLRP